MNIKNHLLAEHSKKQTNEIVDFIGNDIEKFNTLFDIFLKEEYRLVQRAAWVVSEVLIKNKNWINTYIEKLILNLEKPFIHDAVIRNTFKILEKIDIDEKYHGEILDLCTTFLQNIKTPIAIKSYCLTIFSNLAKKYPDLKNELSLLIDINKSIATPAFNSRLKRIKL